MTELERIQERFFIMTNVTRKLAFIFIFCGCSASVADGDLETYSKEGDFQAPGPVYLACEKDSFVMSCGCASSESSIRTLSPTKVPPLGLNGCMCESVEAKGALRVETLCLRRKKV